MTMMMMMMMLVIIQSKVADHPQTGHKRAALDLDRRT